MVPLHMETHQLGMQLTRDPGHGPVLPIDHPVTEESWNWILFASHVAGVVAALQLYGPAHLPYPPIQSGLLLFILLFMQFLCFHFQLSLL